MLRFSLWSAQLLQQEFFWDPSFPRGERTIWKKCVTVRMKLGKSSQQKEARSRSASLPSNLRCLWNNGAAHWTIWLRKKCSTSLREKLNLQWGNCQGPRMLLRRKQFKVKLDFWGFFFLRVLHDNWLQTSKGRLRAVLVLALHNFIDVKFRKVAFQMSKGTKLYLNLL